MDTRHISEEYTEIGHHLINTMPELEYIKNADVQIVFLASEHEKKAGGKLVFGQCERISEKYKWSIPADFTITVFERNIEDFDDFQLEILIFHELLHVGISPDGDFFVNPHDLEDFRAIIDRYGTGWSDTRKLPFEEVKKHDE